MEIIRRHGSTGAFVASLVESRTNRLDDKILDRFYAIYGKIFTLEDERESYIGFQKVLRYNSKKNLLNKFGPFEECIALLSSPVDHADIAAANYVNYAYPRSQDNDQIGGSCQLNFILVDSKYRGLGIADRLLHDVSTSALAFASEHSCSGPVFMTIEQNVPARMTPAQIEDDAVAALIDPVDRIRWWARRGFKILDFPYCQPALAEGLVACDYLDYLIKFLGDNADRTSLSSAVLEEHLWRFFNISVGKFDVEMEKCPEWVRIRQFLRSRPRIDIVTQAP